MGIARHLSKLKEGTEIWNAWRQCNEVVVPDLSAAYLNEADLSGADLRGVDLRGANLSGASLGEADLSGANLSGADLTGTDFTEAQLAGANLSSSSLSWASLRWADLNGVDLRRADLRGATLAAANLTGANLSHTDLSEADLRWADFAGSNLSRAILRENIFGDTNLTNVRGLGTCKHRGPSNLDHRTLAQSGRLPLAFLRGCGLPDTFIDYLPSLFNEAIQFYSCFISYSTLDQAFADRIHADLQNDGVRCWFAPHDLKSGKKVHEQIDEAIRIYDRLLLILSENSIRSRWVETEISKARKRELKEGRRILFPVRLVDFETLGKWECFDADTGKDSAREIREYFIPDFSTWKDHDSYKQGFDRLLRDLKTVTPVAL